MAFSSAGGSPQLQLGERDSLESAQIAATTQIWASALARKVLSSFGCFGFAFVSQFLCLLFSSVFQVLPWLWLRFYRAVFIC
jgi:ornithine cyclodeaminase/alanine dehydrogenase-like protein (mu-crystallin family)